MQPRQAAGGIRWRSVVSVLALGLAGFFATASTAISPETPSNLVAQGAHLFLTEFTPDQGLGPLYNARACVTCHNTPGAGGMGRDTTGVVTRVARISDDGVDLLAGRGGPIARGHSVAELGHSCVLDLGIPAEANLVSIRNAPALYGLGAIEAVPDEVILSGAVLQNDGVQGRPHWVQGTDGVQRIGRFGWKADAASLEQFVADATRNELGITSPLAPRDWLPTRGAGSPRCAGDGDGLDDGGATVAALTAYVASLRPPTLRTGAEGSSGQAIFRDVGCAACHTPYLAAGGDQVWLYSDLLLHDLGPDLDDGLPQGQARGRDWRTTPLWGLGDRVRFLHDARARTVDAAILAHGGEATPTGQLFRELSPSDREALLAFLAAL